MPKLDERERPVDPILMRIVMGKRNVIERADIERLVELDMLVSSFNQRTGARAGGRPSNKLNQRIK